MPLGLYGLAVASLFVLDDMPDRRWPTWPTEVSYVAAALHADGRERPDERLRVRALQSLEPYASGAIAPEVIRALRDPSAQVRAAALQLCYEREIRACLPEAARLWSEGSTPLVRMATLKVIALDPAPSGAAILLAALRDPDDQIRARAAGLLGSATLAPGLRQQTRAALLAKLTDVSSVVRREATRSLGMLGRGSGTLAIARLLDDPDPGVRAAAAQALGQHRDLRAVPALVRTVGVSSETEVSQAAVDALALLPSTEVDEALLGLLDTPPKGLTPERIAVAIGRRPNPAPVLLEGLIDRLQEETSREAALSALLHIGAAALPELKEARRRGLAPSLEVEVERLIGAIQRPKTARPIGLADPAETDRRGWHEALGPGPLHMRITAAARLAELAPDWLDDALSGQFDRVDAPEVWIPWALVATQIRRPIMTEPRHRLAWTRLMGWALTPTLPIAPRCIAMSAAAAAPPGVVEALVGRGLQHLRGDPDPEIRACAVLASARAHPSDPPSWAAALRDPNARVRTAGVLAAWAQQRPRTPELTSALAVLGQTDPSATVRLAARWGLDGEIAPVGGTRWFVTFDVPPYGWASPLDELEIEGAGQRVRVPAYGDHRMRWALVPGAPETLRLLPFPRAELAAP